MDPATDCPDDHNDHRPARSGDHSGKRVVNELDFFKETQIFHVKQEMNPRHDERLQKGIQLDVNVCKTI